MPSRAALGLENLSIQLRHNQISMWLDVLKEQI